jgi:hypothetical protein
MDGSEQDHRSMPRTSDSSRRRINGSVMLMAAAMLLALASPFPALAQGTDVSGIPAGPGNAARGLNGSVLDPSGIGNASRVAPLPQPNLNPVSPPRMSTPTASARLPPAGTVGTSSRLSDVPEHYGARRPRHPDRHTVSARDREIDRKIVGICRGC